MSQTTTCNKCGHEIQFGEWPMCPHPATHDYRDTTLPPVVVHRMMLEDGTYKYSYPGRSDDPTPAGYERVELTTFRQMDSFCRDRDNEERDLRRTQILSEKAHWDERAKERRAAIRQQLQERLGKSDSKYLDLVARYVDQKRERRYQQLLGRSTSFHMEAREMDRSNRKEYIDDNNRKISVVVNGSRR